MGLPFDRDFERLLYPSHDLPVGQVIRGLNGGDMMTEGLLLLQDFSQFRLRIPWPHDKDILCAAQMLAEFLVKTVKILVQTMLGFFYSLRLLRATRTAIT